MKTLGFALCGFLLACAGPAYAQMIKCVDERGVVHYTDKPRPGCRGGEVDIKGQPPISGKLQPRNEDLAHEEREFQKRRMQAEREAQNAASKREQNRRRCASMYAELQRLATQRRVVAADQKGERTILDDKAREARAEKLRADIAQQCS